SGYTDLDNLWTLLVFMVWPGIFVEHRNKPHIQEPVSPVTLSPGPRNADAPVRAGSGRRRLALRAGA
ncbi:hypothetical protein, partial [Nocardia farcinica]|uniref:hypothetical protein n=1 Tax=Nocardia farcinica TaxID=37329 RepID=UPI002455DFD2